MSELIRHLLFAGVGTFRVTDVPQSEGDALIWLFKNTQGPNWTNKTNWLVTPTVANWFGITVAGGRVTVINMPTNNLVGALPAGNWIGKFPSLTQLRLQITALLTGSITGWILPAPLDTLYLYSTAVTGDVSGWVVPASMVLLFLYSTGISGNISGWVVPAATRVLYLYSTGVSGAPAMTSAVALEDFRIHNCGLSQADVDANLLNIYNRRMAFTFATPALNIGGTNAAPSGLYQAACPPTTGKEYAFELVNDSCGDGFNKWAVTFTA